MRSNRLQSLLELLEMSIKYEKDRKNLDAYISKANAVLSPTIGYKKCNGCSALMDRYHSDFQRAIWSAILKEDPRYVPELPALKAPKHTTEYAQQTLKSLPFKELRRYETNCKDSFLAARRRRNLIEEQNYAEDENAIRAYRMSKYTYFETFLPELEAKIAQELAATQEVENIVTEEQDENNKDRRDRLIDKELLLQMKADGKTHQECADYFGVSKPAISKMLKELGWKRN